VIIINSIICELIKISVIIFRLLTFRNSLKYITNFYGILSQKLLAKSLQSNIAVVTKTRALLLLWTSTTVVMWLYVLYCFMAYGNKSPVAWGGLIFTILHTLTPVIFKYTQSFSIAGLSISLTGLGFQTLFCVFSGGVFSPAAIWLTLHPVILGFFGTKRLIIFSVVLNFIIVMMLYLLGHYSFLPPNALPAVFRDSMIISSYVGLDILVAVFTVTAIRINNERNLELNKSKELTENLLRILCHDISNPLTIIRVSSKHLNVENMPQYLRSPDRIRRASEDIQRITDSVSSWIAHKDGKILLQVQKIQISDLIDHILFSFEDNLSSKEIKLNFNVEDYGHEILGDRTAIFYQIINNLVSNAIKFSYEKSEIEITFFAEVQFMVIKIRDYGVGIKEEMIDKVFSPYDKTSSKGTRNERGTGFGLPIVSTVAQRLNGKILIENMTNLATGDRGTCVTVYLPKVNYTNS
jgi:signal transduction histidine kinase